MDIGVVCVWLCAAMFVAYGDQDVVPCHCRNITDCLNDTLECTGGCAAGFTGSRCTEECPEGYYGDKCEEKCGHCRAMNECRHDTGVCTGPCAEGFNGSLCNEEGDFGKSKRNQLKALFIIMPVLLCGFVFLLCWAIWLNRQKHLDGNTMVGTGANITPTSPTSPSTAKRDHPPTSPTSPPTEGGDQKSADSPEEKSEEDDNQKKDDIDSPSSSGSSSASASS